MNDYVIFRKNAWRDSADLERAASRSSRVGNEEMSDRVRWIRSYVYQEDDGTLGSVCVYQAVNPEAVEEHARRAALACTAVLPLVRTVVVADDPAR
jgi:uncharacterized protein DUF4242